MKKFNFLVLLFISIFIFSCSKKDEIAMPQNETRPAEQLNVSKRTLPKLANNLYDRPLKVYNLGTHSSATLHFRSSSKELLASMPLEKFDFTLINTPTPASNNLNKSTTSSSDARINFSTGTKEQKIITADKLKQSERVIYVELESDAKCPALSIEVKSKISKASNNIAAKQESLWPEGTQIFFYTIYNRHRVQIDNLSSYPLNVEFYYDSCDDDICTWTSDGKGTINKYSGYKYTLYLNGWAWYYNCSKTVGALVTIDPNDGYWFRWTIWTNCTP